MQVYAVLLIPSLLFMTAPQTSSLVGDWVTPSHSVVQIYPCHTGGHLCARIEKIGPKNVPRVDAHNPKPALRHRALCGLNIGKDFSANGADRASGGSLYDPASGKTYSGKMQLEGSTLKLRGYIGIPLFGRTEIWHRTNLTPGQMCQQEKD